MLLTCHSYPQLSEFAGVAIASWIQLQYKLRCAFIQTPCSPGVIISSSLRFCFGNSGRHLVCPPTDTCTLTRAAFIS